MRTIIKNLAYDRDFELAVQFNDNTIANLKPLENPDYQELNLASSSEGGGNGGFFGSSSIKLQDCLTWFS